MKEESNFEYNLVDLGLPSGTLWMDRNIGASSPSDYGLYFAWGETDGYTVDELNIKRRFCGDEYKYSNESYNSFTKYCNNSIYGDKGYIDSLVILEDIDDAAYQYTNGECNIPTKELFQELIDNTVSEWTTQDGTCGRLFTSKTNGNSIFIPLTGKCERGFIWNRYFICYLWSCSLSKKTPYNAYNLWFSDRRIVIDEGYERYNGMGIRGVKIK